ncbi:mycothiol synthase [Frankia sp. AgB1.9]|uniref:mycothiol synthase n=1 Tax=unclassified Frankia TaxID=2632575 RepID=UPI0019329606|nr:MULTISPECIES: mycothiol synthase [unclassified Frankia]MBL7490351.1 mycothiol synthase [Frankia sp. AgW1.1]MBL7552757.1 mycothiol synthase [Frankia sp. AgB1.9]MBL7625358.1 mycothiol synthase [Frankia sp. AgB1.8]
MSLLSWSDSLPAGQAAGVGTLVAAAQAADGVGPVSDDVALTLRPGAGASPDRSHLVAADEAGAITGYAQLTRAGDGAWEAELVVHPAHRRHGIGARLVATLLDAVRQAASAVAARPATLDIWAHGDSAAAAALADRTGFSRGRVLLQLRRPLVAFDGADLPEPVWPAGVTVRTFEPGKDEGRWLALNALAFASHPEQGRWTEQDLLPREAEPWFDAAGFFLAERGDDLVGFHWTKVHPVDPAPPAGVVAAGPIGEVYVVGVDPAGAGGGLGRALTLAGLRHLRDDRGLAAVMLYADEDNVRAVRMYEGLGFSRYAVDTKYRAAITGSGF